MFLCIVMFSVVYGFQYVMPEFIKKKKKNVMPVNQCKSVEIDFVAEIKSYMILFVEENEYTWLKQKFYIQLVLS